MIQEQALDLLDLIFEAGWLTISLQKTAVSLGYAHWEAWKAIVIASSV